MGYHARIEKNNVASFLTTRSRNSALWFINNHKLEEAILGYTAKFAARYNVKFYALAIEGNHIQAPALFPGANRAGFMRDWNSAIARAVPRFTPEYDGGRFWGRRYSNEFLPAAEDIEEYFFYTVLQPVKDGLVEKISDYPGYNCFHDAIWGIERQFKVVRWAEYNDAKRFSDDVKLVDFVDVVTLKYERLPGYEELPQKEYALLMMKRLEERRQKIVQDRYACGLGFKGRAAMKQAERGAKPSATKRSHRYSHRPRILAVCAARRHAWKKWYFEIYFAYKEASKLYRAGNRNVEFPEGTYRPVVSPQEVRVE
jgi:hypothetical protein